MVTGCDGQDQIGLATYCRRNLELWAGKVLQFSEPDGLFCGTLEAKKAERYTNRAGLAWEVSKGKILNKLFILEMINTYI